LIDFYELGTPLTNAHYTAHMFGNVYGIPGVPERYRSNVISYRTPVKNLYLTGADTAGHGITGTLMSGLLTSAVMMGIPSHLIKIFKTVQKYSKELEDN
jgi:phytoene dehydrogenase-like protein